ncbi:MAG: polysaccharide pyruvyl transferase family protein [Paracoccaceae bacterium]|nr:polysaccharide pyruvyl transferase family protein [Paracoccaceae bacterium]
MTSRELAVCSQALADRPLLFVGNGPYRNRGCEAIVRGTMEILEGTFGPDIAARAGVMAAPATVQAQQAREIDPRVTNFAVSHVGPRLSRKWWLSQANARLGTQFHGHTADLRGPAQSAACALQLGGDNYSLDYGRPWDYVSVDRWLEKRGIPVVIWGASVGPFEADPKFAPIMHAHLKTLAGIFVRETATRDYLARYGIVGNVHLVADPAFCMTPSEPSNPAVRDLVMDGMIGINISPLVARFSHAGGDLHAWRRNAAEMIVAVAERTDRPVLLVPHVGSPQHDEDDFAFMADLREMVAPRLKMPVKVAPSLGAAELKWLIAKCAVFAGARTHSTIAALSACTPTLSLSYSVKAVGINQDIFGHQEFCKSVKTISVAEFADTMGAMLEDADGIRAALAAKMPEVKASARLAGTLLAELLETRRP